MTSSSERLLTLKARLTAAELAEFQLATGTKKTQLTVSTPTTGTQSVTFTPADLGKLTAYISRLKAEIGDLEGGGDDSSPHAFNWA